LANKPMSGKTSLAGVQDKIVLTRTEKGWARALDGYPSTHILKPASRDHPTVIYDEEYGSRFASALGIAPYDTRIMEFDGVPALIIERYDRASAAAPALAAAVTGLDAADQARADVGPAADTVGPPRRIHQEDFNQILGARGDQKYQRYGGKVSLARIAREFAVLGDRGSLARLARMTVLAVAVGNLDMHAKNISVLHRPDGSVTLAPAYDTLPQAHLPSDGELALAVGGEYRHAAVTREHLIHEIASWGVAEAAETVDAALAVVHQTVRAEVPHVRAHPRLADDVARFTQNLAAGRAAGAR
jgi:serine/threonine-protein kinase HipA